MKYWYTRAQGLRFTFDAGHCYIIRSCSNPNLQGVPRKVDARISDSILEYVYRYEGKQGIHHIFREIHGGWSRTLTDSQLADKSVLDVTSGAALTRKDREARRNVIK